MSAGSFFNKYILPGVVFQSIVIAGGYGTGRELVEFFLKLGPKAGLFGLVIAGLIWGIVCAVSFDYARLYTAYDYRTFFKNLLGKQWWLFEWSYVATVIIVLAIVVSSAGSMLHNLFNTPYNAGVIGLSAYVCYMTWRGSKMIVRTLSFWSFVLYATYFIFAFYCLKAFGGDIKDAFTLPTNFEGSMMAGVKYAAYNLGLIPAVLFSLQAITTRKEAVVSGLMAGIIGIFPGILFFIAMSSHYPEMLSITVPSTLLLEKLQMPWLTALFGIVIFGTLIETAVGLIHALNERLVKQCAEHGIQLSERVRPLIAFLLLLITALIAQLGLINLIEKGYGTLTWVILGVYVLPILTLGLYQMKKHKGELPITIALSPITSVE